MEVAELPEVTKMALKNNMQIDTKVMDRAKGSLERSVKKSVSRIRTPILKICRPDNYNKVVLTD